LLCSDTKYKNTFEKNVFEILLSNTFEVGLKIQNTKYFFSNVFQIQKNIRTGNCRFSTVENVLTVYVYNVKQSTLFRAYIPHSGRVGRLLGWQLLLIN